MIGVFILAILAMIVVFIVSLKTVNANPSASPHGLYCPCPICQVFREPR